VAVWGGSIHGFMFGHVVAAPLFASDRRELTVMHDA